MIQIILNITQQILKILNIINEKEKGAFNEDEKRDIIYILQKYTIFVPSAIKNIKEYLDGKKIKFVIFKSY